MYSYCMTILHMSKSEIDNADSEFLFNVMSMSMATLTHFVSGLAGNNNPGIGTGFSKSSAR